MAALCKLESPLGDFGCYFHGWDKQVASVGFGDPGPWSLSVVGLWRL